VRLTLADSPFADRTGRGVVVAVLDSGVHADHPHVGGIRGGMSFVPDDGANDVLDRIGHGTAVAAAIREKAPGVELIAAKIFHRQLATKADVLVRSIEWAADEGAQLINLSLGTANPMHAERLARAVAYAAERGALVVSARRTHDIDFFPGALAGVAGVTRDEALDRDAIDVERRDGDVPIFSASPYPRSIPNVPRERNLSGVSFAVANVTGFLARAIEHAGGELFSALRVG
jgi:subtilisin family serine protease